MEVTAHLLLCTYEEGRCIGIPPCGDTHCFKARLTHSLAEMEIGSVVEIPISAFHSEFLVLLCSVTPLVVVGRPWALHTVLVEHYEISDMALEQRNMVTVVALLENAFSDVSVLNIDHVNVNAIGS